MVLKAMRSIVRGAASRLLAMKVRQNEKRGETP
jgi:hypothetical protein